MSADSYNVSFLFEDGIERTLRADMNRPLLQQALEQGIPLVHQCQSGSCGTCEAHLISGDVVMSSSNVMILTKSEMAGGARLTCSSFVQSDSTLALPYSADLLYGPSARTWSSQVEEVSLLSNSVARLRLKVLTNGFRFRSGQYARLRIPGTDEWRSYSMATTEAELPRVDFIVKLLSRGVMSDYLRHGWHTGDVVEMESPLGSFYLRDGSSKIVMLAGGTGLAPILSILDQVRITRRPIPPILLCFGCDREEGLFYLDEMELREFWMPSLEVRVVCSNPSPAWEGLVGTPLSVLTEHDLANQETVVYVCGPPGMVEAAHEQISHCSSGIEIFNEQFRPSSI